jgi:hypothetical protein
MWRGAEGVAAMRAAGAWRGEGSSGNRRREKRGAGIYVVGTHVPSSVRAGEVLPRATRTLTTRSRRTNAQIY